MLPAEEMLAGARAVGFDLDGTLIDSAPDLAAAANAALREVGLPELPASRILQFIGRGMDALMDDALQDSGGHAPADAQRRTARQHFRRAYAAQLFERSRVYPGVRTGLRALQARRLLLCCLTNKLDDYAESLLQRAGLRAHFALLLSPGAPAERKPSPALLRRACERLGLMPAELLYVGDSALDVQAARAAGCRVVGVTYGYGGAALRTAQPDALIDSLVRLAPG
ncbi:MAG: phosphoglycolate phosphatase [Gammaproteobacteria bacterium]|nr:phosphoglycolate phosphatase [Gammaproteobacteria bacterium]